MSKSYSTLMECFYKHDHEIKVNYADKCKLYDGCTKRAQIEKIESAHPDFGTVVLFVWRKTQEFSTKT